MDAVKAYLAKIGSKGGRATGEAKRRSAEIARKAGIASGAARRAKSIRANKDAGIVGVENS